jgi:hypothetical protein
VLSGIFILYYLNSSNTYCLVSLFYEVGNLFPKTFLKSLSVLPGCIVRPVPFKAPEIKNTNVNVFGIKIV